jgi:hypothetical protein
VAGKVELAPTLGPPELPATIDEPVSDHWPTDPCTSSGHSTSVRSFMTRAHAERNIVTSLFTRVLTR